MDKASLPSPAQMEFDVSNSNDRDDGEEDDVQLRRASWLALLNFMSRSHFIIFITAIILSVASGIVIPTLAVFLGKIFDLFTSFGAGEIGGSDLKTKVSIYGIALAGLGSASGILNAVFFGSWLLFGELQAKSARERLFDGMLEKDLEWFDMRTAGVETLISRQQTYVTGPGRTRYYLTI